MGLLASVRAEGAACFLYEIDYQGALHCGYVCHPVCVQNLLACNWTGLYIVMQQVLLCYYCVLSGVPLTSPVPISAWPCLHAHASVTPQGPLSLPQALSAHSPEH